MQCQRLNRDGKRCKRKATYLDNYHGDHEVYYGLSGEESKTVSWVVVYLCGHHKQSEDAKKLGVGGG